MRLDGNPQHRISQAVRELGITEPDARELRHRNDRARAAYVRHFYRAEATDPALYDLMLDSTRIPLSNSAELIAAAAIAMHPSPGRQLQR